MPLDLYELESRVGSFTGSQKEFIFSPEHFSAIEGGWGSGKSHALCVKGLVLSAYVPGNIGLIGRYNATDLEDSTMVTFFEVCPPSWIKSYNKTRKVLTLWNGSVVIFRHIHDPNPKRKHITSTNLGWFGIDQMEEIEEKHFNDLDGRLRLDRARKRFGFGAANPNGKDWIYKRFFKELPQELINKFAYLSRRGDHLGIAVKSDENRKSNGGFIDDEVVDRWRAEQPPEYVARYVDCSFEDFSGKIYKEYTLDSVHNIEPFSFPRHWGTVIGIDVGGDAPWSVGVWRVDDQGNLIRTAELYKNNLTALYVANWIKANSNWNGPDTSYVIDPENKLAMLELSENLDHHPIRPAQKVVDPGIIRTQGYIHINPLLTLPTWYAESQDKKRVQRFIGRGSPRLFVCSNCNDWRNEVDNYAWDPLKTNKPIKKQGYPDHACDETRYVCMTRPQAAFIREVEDPKLTKLLEIDPLAYQEWKAYDKRIQARMARKTFNTGMFVEAGVDEMPLSEQENVASTLMGTTRFDWE